MAEGLEGSNAAALGIGPLRGLAVLEQDVKVPGPATYCRTEWVRKYSAAGAGFYAALSEGVTVASLEVGAEGDRLGWRPFVLCATISEQLRVTVAAAAPGCTAAAASSTTFSWSSAQPRAPLGSSLLRLLPCHRALESRPMEGRADAPPDPPTPDRPWIARSVINAFYYLYQDAEWLRQMASDPKLSGSFDRVRCCRTAIVLYAFSLEALINRAWDLFLPDRLTPLFNESRFKLLEKWRLLPLLATSNQSFDIGRYPWSHFAELIRARNEFAHPKPNRTAYYRVLGAHDERAEIVLVDRVEPDNIPEGLGIRREDLVYGQLAIPRDPYMLLPDHLEKVKRVVDHTVDELDRLLGGRVTERKLREIDQMELIHPPGATWPIPAPKQPKP